MALCLFRYSLIVHFLGQSMGNIVDYDDRVCLLKSDNVLGYRDSNFHKSKD